MKNTSISYAQNKEDLILDALFGGKSDGFYIDVGANHVVHDSVTKLFYDKGWHGINIEPASRLYSQLNADRPRDINLNLGVSNKEGELSFREYTLGDGLSTFSVETQKQYEKDQDYKYYASQYVDRKVPVTTLGNIYKKYAPRQVVDFIKIDIEGYEFEAIEGNDWKKYRPAVVCVEANHILKDWRPILLNADYKRALNDGLNDYFIAKEHIKLLDNYSYASVMFFSPITTWKEEKQRLAHERDGRQAQYTIDQLRSENEGLRSIQDQRNRPTTFKLWLRLSILNALRSFGYYINLTPPPKLLTISEDKLSRISKNNLVIMVREHASKKSGGSKHTIKISLAWAYKTIKNRVKRGIVEQ